MLKTYLEEGNASVLQEYREYLNWLPEPEDALPRDLEDQYHYWMEKAGYSLGNLSYPDGEDRSTPGAPVIPWEVALDSMRSARNVGSIFRTADCFGCSRVILGGLTPGTQHAGVKAAAMGCETWIPHETAPDLAACIKHRKSSSLPVIGLETGPHARDISSFSFPDQGLLVLGNEERGLSPALRNACDRLLSIPMYGRKASLNVSSAFAIAAYHIRQGVASEGSAPLKPSIQGTLDNF